MPWFIAERSRVYPYVEYLIGLWGPGGEGGPTSILSIDLLFSREAREGKPDDPQSKGSHSMIGAKHLGVFGQGIQGTQQQV